MHDRVRVPAVGRRALERPARHPFAAQLDSAVRPAQIDAREIAAAVFAGRLQRLGPDVADAGDDRPIVALHAHDRIEARAAHAAADVGRRAERRLDLQARDADDEIGAVLEEVVRDAGVFVVADERRAQETGVRMVARAVDPERRAEAARAHADDRVVRAKHALGIGFDHLEPPAVRIRGRKAVVVAVRRLSKRGFAEETDAAGNVAEASELQRAGGERVGRGSRRDGRFGRDRLRARGRCH